MRPYYCGDGAQCFVCSRLKGRVCGGHRAHRRGFLIRAGSSEVGARSPGAEMGIAFVCMS